MIHNIDFFQLPFFVYLKRKQMNGRKCDEGKEAERSTNLFKRRKIPDDFFQLKKSYITCIPLT